MDRDPQALGASKKQQLRLCALLSLVAERFVLHGPHFSGLTAPVAVWRNQSIWIGLQGTCGGELRFSPHSRVATWRDLQANLRSSTSSST